MGCKGVGGGCAHREAGHTSEVVLPVATSCRLPRLAGLAGGNVVRRGFRRVFYMFVKRAEVGGCVKFVKSVSRCFNNCKACCVLDRGRTKTLCVCFC